MLLSKSSAVAVSIVNDLFISIVMRMGSRETSKQLIFHDDKALVIVCLLVCFY